MQKGKATNRRPSESQATQTRVTLHVPSNEKKKDGRTDEKVECWFICVCGADSSIFLIHERGVCESSIELYEPLPDTRVCTYIMRFVRVVARRSAMTSMCATQQSTLLCHPLISHPHTPRLHIACTPTTHPQVCWGSREGRGQEECDGVIHSGVDLSRIASYRRRSKRRHLIMVRAS